MRIAQLQRPLTAAASGISRPSLGPTSIRQLQDVFSQLRIGGSGAAVEGRRYAAVKSQGMYRLRDSSTIPKKLGAKKSGDSYVIPGNIIYKQRGTKWFPGENVGMGRDHTIYALTTGYVKYYRDPAKHPDRQYIGVVFNKEDKLPYLPHCMRRRKLNMTASIIPQRASEPELSPSGIPNQVVRVGYGRNPHPREERIFKLRKDGSYSYQEEPWRLGTLIRTEKRKMGSRRVAMRQRRKKTKAIQLEMRRDREDKIARRKEALDAQRAAKTRKMKEYYTRKKAELAQKEASSAASGEMPPSQPPPPRVEA
ncbi:ribosomal L27 protein-domain-containing protein [Pseudomassariella vexata]|uniref:Large ribosomal subunit protein bL27m n=1 Tax=Pseudomassariella vexata TaxID=1141098 RepID=A0A1Y2EKM6_9PEZI|nr:ribosomal L27 protein-domain-containing protein [Pseudomassariella vexata]ORY72100.1 ribosomal L27 protein-domain-containing protein [Pseudomassariella vexata]